MSVEPKYIAESIVDYLMFESAGDREKALAAWKEIRALVRERLPWRIGPEEEAPCATNGCDRERVAGGEFCQRCQDDIAEFERTGEVNPGRIGK